jgi:hypothetical protein
LFVLQKRLFDEISSHGRRINNEEVLDAEAGIWGCLFVPHFFPKTNEYRASRPPCQGIRFAEFSKKVTLIHWSCLVILLKLLPPIT